MSQPYPYPQTPGQPTGRPQYLGPGRPGPAPWPSTGQPSTGPGNGYAPPPPAGYPVPARPYPMLRKPPPRPAAVTIAAVLTVTASLQFLCTLSFVWLLVVGGMQQLPTNDLGADSALYYILRRFHLAMLDGLAWPLYLAPLIAFVLGLMILIPRSWTRWAFSAWGVVVLAWSAIWLHRQFVYWIPPALYVLVACLIVWTPAATAWYRARGRAED